MGKHGGCQFRPQQTTNRVSGQKLGGGDLCDYAHVSKSSPESFTILNLELRKPRTIKIKQMPQQ
jgi:hypothetical protein